MTAHDPKSHWNSRYADGPGISSVAPFMDVVQPYLPASGTAVDLAGGSGRNAIWLAQQGLATTLIDVSDVALDHARTAAEAGGVELELVTHDLEGEGIPQRSWDVALIHLFLDREVLGAVASHLNPGGLVLFMQPTVTNLQRHEHPSERFLLQDGELAQWLAAQPLLEEVQLTEGWVEATGRHEAQLIARRIR